MEWAAKSDVGLVRKSNEDSYKVRITSGKPAIAIVADGMGGYQGGKVASSITVDSIIEGIDQFYPDDRDASSSDIDPAIILKRAIRYANEKVFKHAQENQDLLGMGTTVVVALLLDEEIIIGHVGDSRAYLVCDANIQQLTKDHSLVNELVKQGKISNEEALVHPQRNMITRALGTNAQVSVDIEKVSWTDNNVLLLCTDGLSGVVSGEELLAAFIEKQEVEDAVNYLLEKSLKVDGKDNITIVAVRKRQIQVDSEGVN
ncbi:Stp1/IreP family PP2C-type Ser/Thr phosphatase [Desulfuribacillus alkaliarsenatis]|uniref:PPM-type phosphatase domain-containing protein n=1 Tax=Desulfuribacillus alkaliarsenatis TaxID=766136 RepID=A0A1E5G5T1_9FIRM|nr:Stp1/IreP family PP2C-type Ser/Thr phosphatase [Desulfuribacillus alkaliarsenatis]OEF98538.1 hypothetical protein BHF68_02415 [Desulfuribacillus alkaliarsenatis]